MTRSLLDTLRSLAGGLVQIGARRRRRRDMLQLEQSGLFDGAWYLEAYPDVRESGIDPLRHYFHSGWKEGRDPGPHFSTTAYLKANSDVAALGINPLLHFVEYGHAEGRGLPDFGSPTRSSIAPLEDFGPAAPCIRAPLPADRFVKWERSGQFGAMSGPRVEIDGKVIATIPRDMPADCWEKTADAIRSLASWDQRIDEATALEWGESLAPLDAWHAGRRILRVRWSPADTPTVVRALRLSGDGFILAGEAAVASELDILDVKMAEYPGPILFVFTTVEGRLVGTSLLMFPALCRGGTHYSELLALMHAGRADGLASGDRALRENLIRLRAGAVRPLVSEIIVDVQECDGTQPLFSRHFQNWLGRLFGVSIRASEVSPQSDAEAYLASTISSGQAGRQQGAGLKLHGSMIPTISSLVASSDGAAGDADVIGPLIVSAEEPAQASTYVRVPPGLRARDLPGGGAGLPSLAGGNLPDEITALALQVPTNRALSEAELLFPESGQAKAEVEATIDVSWLIWPAEWTKDALTEALQALAGQSCRPATIILVGTIPASFDVQSQSSLHRAIETAKDLSHALAIVKSAYVGYLGAEIILHDRRTIEAIGEIAKTPAALTSSTEVVSVEPRGTGWKVTPATAGGLHRLPRMILPLSQPPEDFWIARASSVANRSSDGEPAGVHFCSTHVTVSRLKSRKARPPIEWPRAGAAHSVSLDLLVG